MTGPSLVERLRARASFLALETSWSSPDRGAIIGPDHANVMNDAAARIEALEAALRKIDGQVSHAFMGDWSIALREIRETARAALKGQP